jgi:hypothetical protein
MKARTASSIVAVTIAAIIVTTSLCQAEWFRAVSPSNQMPILSYTTYGFSHPIPVGASLPVNAEPVRLRITDARVHGVTESHVILVSSETSDVLLLPLKKAVADFQIRGRADKFVNEALARKGEQADDDFAANAWLIEDGASEKVSSFARQHKAARPSSSGRREDVGSPNLSPLMAPREQQQDFFEQQAVHHRRRVYDMQKESARFHDDFVRQSRRNAEDARNGYDPLIAAERRMDDTQRDMNRAMRDSEVDRMRSMNDAAAHMGGPLVRPEPAFYSPNVDNSP